MNEGKNPGFVRWITLMVTFLKQSCMNEKECLVAVFDLGGVFTRLIGKPAAFSITILSL